MSGEASDSVERKAAKEFDRLAMQYWMQKDIPEAISYYRKALEIREAALGPHHYEVANNLTSLAGLIGQGQRDSPERVALWERAASIFERLCLERAAPQGVPSEYVFEGLLGTLGNLAGHAFFRGKVDEAERDFRRIQAMMEERRGPDRCRLHPTLPTFAKVLIRQGKAEEAEERLRAAIGKTPKMDSIDEWLYPECQKVLADLCMKQGRAAEAEALYRQAVAIMERASRPLPWLLAAAVEGLADLCRKSDRAAEAERLEKRVQELRGPAEPSAADVTMKVNPRLRDDGR